MVAACAAAVITGGCTSTTAGTVVAGAAPTVRSSSPTSIAARAIDSLANLPDDVSGVLRDIWLLWLRALLAKAPGNESAYRDYWDRYRAMATPLGFEGHMKWAEEMA
jgi:adenylate cyclase